MYEQCVPDHHLDGAKMENNIEINKALIECFYRSQPFDENVKQVKSYTVWVFIISSCYSVY